MAGDPIRFVVRTINAVYVGRLGEGGEAIAGEWRQGALGTPPITGAGNMFARLMGLKTVSPAALHRMMQERQVTVIDVNSRSSWLGARVPGAHNLDPAGFNERDLPPDPAARLVFYCSNPMCRKAPHAARRARKMGYSDVRVMSAGINGWVAAKLPTAAGE